MPESTPRRANPGLPGRSSSARRPRRSWPATSSCPTCSTAPRLTSGRGRARDPAPPHSRSYPASNGRVDRPAGTQPDHGPRRPGAPVRAGNLVHGLKPRASTWVGNLYPGLRPAQARSGSTVPQRRCPARSPRASAGRNRRRLAAVPPKDSAGGDQAPAFPADAGSARRGWRGRPSPAEAGDWCGAARRPRAAARAARRSWKPATGQAGPASHTAGRR